MKKKLILSLVAISMLSNLSLAQSKTGAEVIQLMKEKYNNKYIQNFTFSQDVFEYRNDSVISKTVWHEAYSYPHQLIIKDTISNNSSGYVYNWDTLYIMNDYKISNKLKRHNDLIILAFDIYEQAAEKTMKMLEGAGYNLNKSYSAILNEREVYCIGAESEADSSHKFYIDKEHLYLIGTVKYYEDGVWETYFDNYQEIDGVVIATQVLFYFNGNLSMTEDYYNIKFPETINFVIYNPYKFKEASW